jgi:hypothetical protein
MTNTALKAQIDSQITNETTQNSITPTEVGVNIKAVVDYVDQENLEVVSYGLTAQGTSVSTTSLLNYGVNVFDICSSSNYATKLPQPITGKTVKIINRGAFSLLVFPSNVGGRIGILPIDTPAQVPADGKTYEFTCIKNPVIGEWAFDTSTGKNILFLEFSVAHTNGVGTNRFGVSQSGLSVNNGMGLDGAFNIVLQGEWKSEAFAGSVSKIACDTNILQTDLASTSSGDAINGAFIQGFKTASNSTSFGQKASINFSDGSFSPTGTLFTPAQIGDTNTMYSDSLVVGDLIDYQIGLGGSFSRYYYTFGMFIPSTAATKTYKFKWRLEYV